MLQSPSALSENLNDLQMILSNDRSHIDSLDRRARALQTSSDTFGTVSTEVAASIKLLDEIAAELAKEEEEMARKTKQRDALSDRHNNAKEVERAKTLLNRQLDKWGERTAKLREQAATKAQEAKERMLELKAMHESLHKERAEKDQEMEVRKVRIQQTELKVSSSLRATVLDLQHTDWCSCRWPTFVRRQRTRWTRQGRSISRWSRTLSCTSQRWSRISHDHLKSYESTIGHWRKGTRNDYDF
jgi:DNA repair exonuclease SbcCD ATPase subunit